MMNGILILCLCGLIPFFDGEQERAKKQKTTVATVARARMRAARTVREITQKGIQTCPRCDAFLDTSKEFRDYVETLFASCRKEDETAVVSDTIEADTAEAVAVAEAAAKSVEAEAADGGEMVAIDLTEYPATGDGTETAIAVSESDLANPDVVIGVPEATPSETSSDAAQGSTSDTDEAAQEAAATGSAAQDYPTVAVANGVEVDDALGYEAAGCFKNIAVAAEKAYEIIYDFRITDFQRHDNQTASLTVSVSNAQDIASFYIGTKLTLYAIHADHSRTALATWSCMENDLNTATFENIPLGDAPQLLLVVCASPPIYVETVEDSGDESGTESAATESLPANDSGDEATSLPAADAEDPPAANAEETPPLINDDLYEPPDVPILPADEDVWGELIGSGDMPLLPGEPIIDDSLIAR